MLGLRVKVFKWVTNEMNMQLRFVLDKDRAINYMHRRNNIKIFGRSMCRCFSNVSDLVKVRDGGGGTFKHIFTLKNKDKRINSFMNLS